MAPVVVLITDPRFDDQRTADVVRAAAQAVGPGRLVVQLRDKESRDEASLRDAARALRDLTREAGALFTVNGSISIAREVGADGIHLPSGAAAELESRLRSARALLGDAAFISTAAHDDADVRSAIAGGASAVLVSPIFETPAKGAPRGLEAIASARALVDGSWREPPLLVYALGGVTGANAADCAAKGASGAAVIRELFQARDVGQSARDLAGPFVGAS